MGCGEEERRILTYKNDSCSKIISNATRDTDALDDWHLHRPSGGQASEWHLTVWPLASILARTCYRRTRDHDRQRRLLHARCRRLDAALSIIKTGVYPLRPLRSLQSPKASISAIDQRSFIGFFSFFGDFLSNWMVWVLISSCDSIIIYPYLYDLIVKIVLKTNC